MSEQGTSSTTLPTGDIWSLDHSGNPAASGNSRYYCHNCVAEYHGSLNRIDNEPICSTCTSGFVEILEDTDQSPSNTSDQHNQSSTVRDPFYQLQDIIQEAFHRGLRLPVRMDSPPSDPRVRSTVSLGTPANDVRRIRATIHTQGQEQNIPGQEHRFENILNDVLYGLGAGFGQAVGGAAPLPIRDQVQDFLQMTIQRGLGLPPRIDSSQRRISGNNSRDSENNSRSDRQEQNFGNIITDTLYGLGTRFNEAIGGTAAPLYSLLVGNPGDYAWGREGLDAIVTQLLNQMDGTGPPPLSTEKIREIPLVNITQENIDVNLQCSVCWENFQLDESVRKLPCEHLYHTPCIEPWLQLHGTCPICRKTLNNDTNATAGHESTDTINMASLASAFLGSATSSRSSSNTSTGSTSSNSTSTSSNSTSNSNSTSSQSQPQPGRRFFDMDFD